MIIIGITGTLGAGKGTIVSYLCERFGFSHFSVRALVTEYIHQKGLEVDRDSMVVVANALRQKHGPSVLVEILFERAKKEGKNCVIESIRTPGEVAALRKQDLFHLFAVDADAKLRFERIKIRDSETDRISFETFLANEAREMASTDPNHQNLRACIQLADYVFRNDSSQADLYTEIEAVLERIMKEDTK